MSQDEVAREAAESVRRVLDGIRVGELTATGGMVRLPVLVLEVTGQRVGELERLTWGDVDVPESRWRVTHRKSKTGQARWVQLPSDLMAAVLDTCPPEDRDADASVFPGLTQANLRQELTRACRAAEVPHFSPHDLRHRRISLWHRDRVPWADIGQRVGQRNLSTTADTYTHVIVEGEVDRRRWLD